MSYVDGNEYQPNAYTSYSGSSSPEYSGSSSPDFRSEYNYKDTASKLEASIAASAATKESYSSETATSSYGVFAAATTPVGGGTVEFGVYSDKYGMVGAYWNIGGSLGVEGLSLGVVHAKSESLAGESVSLSYSISNPLKVVPIPIGYSRGVSIEPSTGRVTGDQWSLALNVGPPIGVAINYTSADTSEFTSLYLVYIQFLNWAGYPGTGF